MNEQLVVKKFGPIEDAKVDFKRVTIFIGPTGGGKSTLAKLGAIFKNKNSFAKGEVGMTNIINEYALNDYFESDSYLEWTVFPAKMLFENNVWKQGFHQIIREEKDEIFKFLDEVKEGLSALNKLVGEDRFSPETTEKLSSLKEKQQKINRFLKNYAAPYSPHYLPAERIMLSILGDAWPDLISQKVDLPATFISFAKGFLDARKTVQQLFMLPIDSEYQFTDGIDKIKLSTGRHIDLTHTASGIQSITPLLVLLESLSRNTEQAQSFIIEEPELNLYPTAQRDLVYTMLEKCTQGKNDLTITTHSPYVLSALNLALYANKVAALFPHQHKKVAKIIPEKYWLKANEFSAYYISKGQAKNIFNEKTGLLSESQLDEVSGHFADVFDRLTDLRVSEKKAPAKAKSAKK